MATLIELEHSWMASQGHPRQGQRGGDVAAVWRSVYGYFGWRLRGISDQKPGCICPVTTDPPDRISGNFLDIPLDISFTGTIGQGALAMEERLLLSNDEVEDITGYQKPKRQLRALAQMGIRAKQNARGRV